MTQEEDRLHRKRRERIVRVKRILRWMPRRSNVHRYPVLRWFAEATRKRSYLWCFRVRSAVPAIYAGCILVLLPLYGIQIPLALLVAFALKVNLPILVSIQLLTNPLTVVPAYYACYQVGKVVLNVLGADFPNLSMSSIGSIIGSLEAGSWTLSIGHLGMIWLVTSLGSLILGVFLGTVGSTFYKLAAYEVAQSYTRLKHLQEKRQEKANEESASIISKEKENSHG